jgi:nucleoside-diphosphate-sugar epimerase
VLGWKPDIDLAEGIQRTVDWLRDRLDRQAAALVRA